MQTDITLYCGAVLHALAPRQCEYFPDGSLVVQDGIVLFAGGRELAAQRYPSATVVDYSHALLLPGLIDTHVHLPQWPIAGLGGGELLEWLQRFVFPAEALHADREIAHSRSLQFFRDALACGTTTLAVYCSPLYQATHEAFRAAAETGVRVLMGRTLMDTGAPAYLLASAQQNIEECVKLANDWHLYDAGRMQYAVTPRFAPACTPELLRRCGELARSENLLIQTHLAENPLELSLVAEVFPDSTSYTHVYERSGLLTDRSVLAHCIHLSAGEQRSIGEHGCSIAHCPTSNRFLQSGVMALRRYLNAGLKVALGTDVGAGYSLSVLHEAKEAIETSKTWNIMHRNEEEEVLSPEETFWLATLGGATALGMEQKVGNFQIGKEADFIAVERPRFSTDTHTPAELLARLMYGLPRVLKVHVRGAVVYDGGETGDWRQETGR